MSTQIDNIYILFGVRLQEERKRLFGNSQEKAGVACGVTRVMWGQYERGKAAPGVGILLRLAAAGADVQYVLTGQRSTPLLTAEQERAGYVVEILSPTEAAALATLRASGLLKGGDVSPQIKQSISGNANVMVGINNGSMSSEQTSGESGRKRRG